MINVICRLIRALFTVRLLLLPDAMTGLFPLYEKCLFSLLMLYATYILSNSQITASGHFKWSQIRYEIEGLCILNAFL